MSEYNHLENTYVNADIRLDPDGELLPTDHYTELCAAATRPRMIFLIPLHLPTNPANSTLSQAHPSLNLTMEYPSLRRETTEECFSAEMDFIVVVKR